MASSNYPRASQYPDLETIYAQCSGPGALKLAEFLADKLHLQPNQRLLDVGTNRGLQSCFLAKEYGVFVVGIDPWIDRDGLTTHVDYLHANAQSWGVTDLVLGVQVGVPDTRFAANTFDVVFSTTTLEMIRGMEGADAYQEALAEIWRVLKPGGLFGLAEPMHLDVELPADLAPLVTRGELPWTACFTTIDQTASACEAVGFMIQEAAYAPDAPLWWEEYATYDPYCRQDPDGDARTIQIDAGRWLSFGYVVAQKRPAGNN